MHADLACADVIFDRQQGDGPMVERTGWSASEMWRARAARLQLRRAIDASKANRVRAMQNRFTVRYECLERRRQHLVRSALQISETTSQEDRQALTQRILQYYQDVGALDRAVAASVGA